MRPRILAAPHPTLAPGDGGEGGVRGSGSLPESVGAPGAGVTVAAAAGAAAVASGADGRLLDARRRAMTGRSRSAPGCPHVPWRRRLSAGVGASSMCPTTMTQGCVNHSDRSQPCVAAR